jgi:hypothetical protein
MRDPSAHNPAGETAPDRRESRAVPSGRKLLLSVLIPVFNEEELVATSINRVLVI